MKWDRPLLVYFAVMCVIETVCLCWLCAQVIPATAALLSH